MKFTTRPENVTGDGPVVRDEIVCSVYSRSGFHSRVVGS